MFCLPCTLRGTRSVPLFLSSRAKPRDPSPHIISKNLIFVNKKTALDICPTQDILMFWIDGLPPKTQRIEFVHKPLWELASSFLGSASVDPIDQHLICTQFFCHITVAILLFEFLERSEMLPVIVFNHIPHKTNFVELFYQFVWQLTSLFALSMIYYPSTEFCILLISQWYEAISVGFLIRHELHNHFFISLADHIPHKPKFIELYLPRGLA